MRQQYNLNINYELRDRTVPLLTAYYFAWLQERGQIRPSSYLSQNERMAVDAKSTQGHQKFIEPLPVTVRKSLLNNELLSLLLPEYPNLRREIEIQALSLPTLVTVCWYWPIWARVLQCRDTQCRSSNLAACRESALQ